MTLFVDACLAAALVVALLASLETAQRSEFNPFGMPADCSPYAVAGAVDAVEQTSFSQLCAAAVESVQCVAGPSSSKAATNLTGPTTVPFRPASLHSRHRKRSLSTTCGEMNAAGRS